MSRWEHPGLLLLFGSVLGGIVTAIYLTDFFGFHLPAVLFPESIDSGWGSLLGGVITGVVAVGLFLVQRHVDRRDRDKFVKAEDAIRLSRAEQHLKKVGSFFDNPRVLAGLGGWLRSEDFDYITKDLDEIINAVAILRVRASSFANAIGKSSDCLYEIAGHGRVYSKFRRDVHRWAIDLRETSDSFAENLLEIKVKDWESPETLSDDDRSHICRLITVSLLQIKSALLTLEVLRERVLLLSLQEGSSRI